MAKPTSLDMSMPGTDIEQIPYVKVMIPIGAGFDIPTGRYKKSTKGHYVLNGGYGITNAVVGRGNTFKSTIAKFMMLSAAEAVAKAFGKTKLFTYDTEMNTHIDRLDTLLQGMPTLVSMNILEEGIWNISDKTLYWGDQYHEKMKNYLRAKRQMANKLTVKTQFLDAEGKQLEILLPTFQDIDSVTEWEDSKAAATQDTVAIGDKEALTLHLHLGLSKTRMIMDLPNLSMRNYHYTNLTAHLDTDIHIGSGPRDVPPPRKMGHMRSGDKVKGVPSKFFFLMANCNETKSATPLINPKTKTPEYPLDSDDNNTPSMDLYVVTLKQWRGKSGQSGVTIDVVVSQTEGVLVPLSDFHDIKQNGRFGLGGNLQNYYLELCPDISLARTTVRRKLAENPKLARAAAISRQLLQMRTLWRQYSRDFICTPKELYDDLKAKGYDWDLLLTIPEHSIFDNGKPIKGLSTWDLLNMRLPETHPEYYFPYWMNPDKTIKAEYKD